MGLKCLWWFIYLLNSFSLALLLFYSWFCPGCTFLFKLAWPKFDQIFYCWWSFGSVTECVHLIPYLCEAILLLTKSTFLFFWWPYLRMSFFPILLFNRFVNGTLCSFKHLYCNLPIFILHACCRVWSNLCKVLGWGCRDEGCYWKNWWPCCSSWKFRSFCFQRLFQASFWRRGTISRSLLQVSWSFMKHLVLLLLTYHFILFFLFTPPNELWLAFVPKPKNQS